MGNTEIMDIKNEFTLNYIAKLIITKLCIPTEKPLKNMASIIDNFLVLFIACSVFIGLFSTPFKIVKDSPIIRLLFYYFFSKAILPKAIEPINPASSPSPG